MMQIQTIQTGSTKVSSTVPNRATLIQNWLTAINYSATTALDEVTTESVHTPAYTVSGQPAPEGYKV